jgi:hypothetical protein
MRLTGKERAMQLKIVIFEVKKVGSVFFMSFLFLAIANLNFANAESQKAPKPVAAVAEKADSSAHNFPNEPQEFVVCTGWHALCSASYDCKVNGDKADCDCMRVNETHIAATSEIQDAAVKRKTEIKCTNVHPCDVDQAPVCKAIRNGQYTVDHVKYDWVSTYSYRGWCSLLAQGLKACDPGADGYTGDTSWAICDLAPCTEIQNPSDPDKPLSCQCRVVKDTPFVGMRNSCTGDNGGIMSSMVLEAWDFQNNTYPFPMPGYEYVQGACAPLGSDPLPQQ